MRDGGGEVAIFDSAGKDAELFHYAADGAPDSVSSRFLARTRMWFDSVWSTLGTEAADG
ncbi:hypothetical protein [Promicromonospora sp. NPDC090134]|uniref:hypothetical protein n=1 Tax=Promicromonospora sp. NPDC090134 TaxID=3364408 RepID=UPI0038020793